MRYVLIADAAVTTPAPTAADPGAARDFAPGQVVNVIEYDGESPYEPGPGLRLMPSDTLQIGDEAGA